MAAYHFLTAWALESPIDPVFETIHDSERWPEWWKGVESAVELEPGDSNGVGSLSRYVWKSRLPYELAFQMRITQVERPSLMEGAAEGELRGTGRWRLFEGPGTTAVLYDWDVETTAAWMNLLAPIARPIFKWNHDVVMRQGGEGLARRLGVRLLAGTA